MLAVNVLHLNQAMTLQASAPLAFERLCGHVASMPGPSATQLCVHVHVGMQSESTCSGGQQSYF